MSIFGFLESPEKVVVTEKGRSFFEVLDQLTVCLALDHGSEAFDIKTFIWNTK